MCSKKGTYKFNEIEKKLIVDCYDSEVNYFDENFGFFVNVLKQEGLFDNSMIFLTADHGEEFWEHGWWGHLMRMYDYNLRVPFLFSYPQFLKSNKVVNKQVRNIDIFPTITDMLGHCSVLPPRLLVQRGIRNRRKKPRDQNTAWITKYVMSMSVSADYMRLLCLAQDLP